VAAWVFLFQFMIFLKIAELFPPKLAKIVQFTLEKTSPKKIQNFSGINK